jgi:hypothetical protein
MKKDQDGQPVIERSSCGLGVRVDGERPDILPSADGNVHPESGGMSVVLDRATNLPRHRLPVGLGGLGRYPVFRISEKAIPATLLVRVSGHPHALIELRVICMLAEYEQQLASTRPAWEWNP